MVRLDKIRNSFFMRGKAVFFLAALLCMILVITISASARAQEGSPPVKASEVVNSLNASQWQELENGLSVIRATTADGIMMTAFSMSQENFTFSIELQNDKTGSHVKQIGEQEGAVIAANAGFFASSSSGELYSVGYLRLNGKVLSKGWGSSGGIVSFKSDRLELLPTHKGLPAGNFDVIQSKPMLIEPGGIWAMGSNSGFAKPRTILCKLANGNIILSTVTRIGLTLFEAGWIMRAKEKGGFFGCDAALAFDGGRSTQVYYSGDEKYSSNGISPVHNFFVVRQKED